MVVFWKQECVYKFPYFQCFYSGCYPNGDMCFGLLHHVLCFCCVDSEERTIFLFRLSMVYNRNIFFQPISSTSIWTNSVALKMEVQGEHKVFPWLQTFITRKLLYMEYKHIYVYIYIPPPPKCNSRSFLQHINTLQHVPLMLHAERLIDNQFLSTCSPTCLQLS